MKVTVILPARNEEEAIGKVLDEIESVKAYLKPTDIELDVLVVDSSIDNTVKIAEEHGAYVCICLPRGKGMAFKYGLDSIKILVTKPDIVIMADADYTYPLFAPVLEAIAELSKADVVIGYRKWREPSSMTQLNLFGNRLLSSLATLLYGYRVRDVCSGFWGFRKETLDKFNITSKGFTLEADLFINARKNHCKIAQFPIRYRARIGKSQAKFKPVIDWFKILRFLINRIFTRS